MWAKPGENVDLDLLLILLPKYSCGENVGTRLIGQNLGEMLIHIFSILSSPPKQFFYSEENVGTMLM